MADQWSRKWPKTRLQVDALTKDEAMALANYLAVVVSSSWPAGEIRDEVKDFLFPAGTKDDRQDLKGLGGKKKKELQELAAKLGAPAEATCDGLRHSIRMVVMQNSAPRHTDLMDFGPHHEKRTRMSGRDFRHTSTSARRKRRGFAHRSSGAS